MKWVKKELVAATNRAAIFAEGSSVISEAGVWERGELRVWRLVVGIEPEEIVAKVAGRLRQVPRLKEFRLKEIT